MISNPLKTLPSVFSAVSSPCVLARCSRLLPTLHPTSYCELAVRESCSAKAGHLRPGDKPAARPQLGPEFSLMHTRDGIQQPGDPGEAAVENMKMHGWKKSRAVRLKQGSTTCSCRAARGSVTTLALNFRNMVSCKTKAKPEPISNPGRQTIRNFKERKVSIESRIVNAVSSL